MIIPVGQVQWNRISYIFFPTHKTLSVVEVKLFFEYDVVEIEAIFVIFFLSRKRKNKVKTWTQVW